MSEEYKYYLVDVNVLPEVFVKTAKAKQLLAQGKASSMSDAAKMAGLSRSAFYKYKNSISPYIGTSMQNIATIYSALLDEPGVLSALLGELSGHGGNILTINQNIPVDGVAPVSVSLRTDKLIISPGELMEKIKTLYGVVDIKLLAE